MPTGSLIRDFYKEYRELRFTTSGSFELSEIEHNAYLQRLTIEVDNLDGPRYGSFKTLPLNTHFGYLTTFKGTSVLNTIGVKYARQRVLEQINENIWNYHQATEAVQISSGVSVKSATRSADSVVERVGENVGDLLCFVIGVGDALPGIPVPTFILETLGCDEPGAENESIVTRYRGFPIASPFPDIFKFKGDVPMSFRFRLESWYLVNPVVYIADSPTDTSDETEDEDEYPTPDEGDGDGDGEEFPTPDPIPTGRDPRDFPTGSGSQDWFEGALAKVTYTRYPYAPGCTQLTFTSDIELGSTQSGEYSFEYIGSVNGCDGAQTAGGLNLVAPNGVRVQIAVLEEQQWKIATVDSVVYY